MALHHIKIDRPILQETCRGTFKRVGVSLQHINVRTTHEFPPIPIRSMDWSAVDDDTYDVDCDQDGFFSTSPVGRGATEQEAINDLLEQLEDR